MTESITNSITDRYGAPRYAGQRMAKADFLRWESDDNYVYEYNNGLLEPTTAMRQNETYLYRVIEDYFFSTNTFLEGGRLWGEIDVWLSEKQMRRPDISYFSANQISLMAAGSNVIPHFVIELASESDNDLRNLTKLHEYFEAGVQVVWWVYPMFQEVYVYTSPKTVTIATDTDVLSAAPALPDFQMTVAALFKR